MSSVASPHRETRFAALLFIALSVCYAYFLPRWADWNENSRLDLTLAIVEQGTIRIDDYYENTGDYAAYGGHVYTDKAPGLSFLAVPVYLAFRTLMETPAMRALLRRAAGSAAFANTLREGGTGLGEEKVYFAAALYAASFFTVSLPSALAAMTLYLFLARLVADPLRRLVLALAYAVATIAFPYAWAFYGHQTAAALLFLAFVLLYRLRLGGGRENLWLAGAILGLAVLVDFAALLPAAVLTLYAYRLLDRKRDLFKLAVGALPFAAVLAFYNAAAFGSPFASSYRHLVRFKEISDTGFLGFGVPSLTALWGITFSPYRGLFFLSPFLLLAVPGFYQLLRSDRWRAEAAAWLAIVIAQLLLVSAWYDWRGGFAVGPRNLLLVVPFLMPPVAAAANAWWNSRMQRRVAQALFAVSFVAVWIASVSGQDFAPIDVARPLSDFFWPRFRTGDVARNLGMAFGLPGRWSLLPPLALLGGLLWIARSDSVRTGKTARR